MKFKYGTRRRAIEYEKDWVKRWKEDGTFEKSVEQRPIDDSYVFYDGPPFITGVPHHGTLLSSIVKDAVPRYWTMKGKRVERVWGWDCHGLPAEVFTEKKLGIKDRRDIGTKITLEEYIKTARENMVQTSSLWNDTIDRIGRWVDMEHAYKTMDKDYMESIWWGFKTLYDKGKIYEGERVLLYCTRDATPLSKAEVTMDSGAYQEVTDPSVYVKFKLTANPERHDVSLREVSLDDGDREREYLRTVARDENGFLNPATEEELASKTNFAHFLQRMVDTSHGVNLPDGYVPSTLYWVEKSGEIVGAAKLRPELNDSLRNQGGGNIGIGGIPEKYRGEGIGTQVVQLLAEELQDRRVEQLIYTVHEDNLASRRIAEKLGGVLEKSIDDPKYPGVKERFYVIDLEKPKTADKYLLAWTTTPWTLPANTAVGVGKDEPYVELETTDGEHLIMHKDLVSRVMTDEKHQPLPYKFVQQFRGSDLVGLGYEPLLGVDRGENAHKVWDYPGLSAEEGTGIVHLAPAYGEEDFELAKVNNIPVVHVIDANGLYSETEWRGLNVWETNKVVAKALHERGIVWKIEYVRHSYPHCHRCGTRLMYRAHPSWFFDVDGQKDLMLEKADEQINWFPEHLKHGRWQKNIEAAPDWNLSRDRFWATAMPVWEGVDRDGRNTDDSGKKYQIVVGSYDELYQLSGKKLDDYHRPWVDDIEFDKDGIHYRRIDKVLDGWFESGSMPYAQFHYPFENKQKFEANFPGDFIAEYIGQVRAWFYYLHVVSVGLFGQSAFKEVITTGVVAGNDGRKMSKSYGNYTDPNELMDKFSADSLRFLLLSSPLLKGEDFALQDKEVGDVARKLSMIWNMYDFFTMYAEVDGWEYDGNLVDPLTADTNVTNPLDVWIVSRVHQLAAEVEENMDKYDIPNALAPVLPFLDDASNWYVRRSRRRFWKSEDDNDKNDAYRTLHYILARLSYLLAPFTPFLAEELYHNLTGDKGSVHLENWLPAGHVDELVIDRMARTRELINAGLGLRMQKDEHQDSIKVRQPLQFASYAGDKLDDYYEQIIAEELNVKEVRHVADLPKHLVDYDVANGDIDPKSWLEINKQLTPALKREGLMREIVRYVQAARKKAGLQVDDRIKLSLKSDDQMLREAIEQFAADIKQETLAKELDNSSIYSYSEDNKIDQAELKISLQKD